MASEQLVAPIAKLWCRSFGVADEKAIERLTKLLISRAQDELAAGVGLNRIQSHFDELAAKLIGDWFSLVLGREIPLAGKSLAILRLAFLDANYNGKWSPAFLSDDVYVQELSAELDSLIIEPTPVSAPRTMVRQVF